MAQKDRDHVRRLREEANAIRRQEAAAKRRKTVLTNVGIIVGAVVVIGAIVWAFIFLPGIVNKAPAFGSTTASTSITSTVTGETTEAPVATGDGGVVTIGQPDAPVTLQLYYDVSCPHCVDYHQQVGSAFTDLIATGQAKVDFHTINYVAPYGEQAGGALLAIAQHDPANFLTAMDAFFQVPAATQQNWGASDYAALLPSVGVTNPEAVAAVESGEYVRVVKQATQDARNAGVEGTPSVGVNGQLQDPLPMGPELYALVNANGGAVEVPAA